MYARVIAFSGADSGKREAALEMIRGTVIPMLRSYDGYEGYISLYDEENSRAKAIILWESKEAAESAEETLVERRAKMTAQVGITVEAANLYEAPVIDLEGARVGERIESRGPGREGAPLNLAPVLDERD